MRIRVVDADVEDLVHERLGEAIGERFQVEPAEPVDLADVRRHHELLDEDPFTREVRVHGGQPQTVGVLHRRLELLGIVAFDGEIEFLAYTVEEVTGEIDGMHREPERRAPFDQPCELHHRFAVARHHLVEVRSLHLHDDLVTVGETRPIHLCDRGAGQRLPVEGLEHVLRGCAELRGDVRTHRRLGLGLGGAAQLAQLLAPCGRQHVGPSRRHLSQLHEDATGLLQRVADADREFLSRRRTRRHPVATGDGDHLPVATQGFDLVAHAGDGIRDRHQPRRLAGRERPDRSEEVDEDRHAHREQRAEDNGDRDHREGGAFPVGDEPGHDDRCGPADDAGDEQCDPAPPGAEQATGHEHDEQAEECAEDQPSEE